MRRAKLPGDQPPSWAYYAKKVVFTVALVAVLAVLFYLVVMSVGDAGAESGVHYWLTLLLTVLSIVLTSRYLIDGIREGEFPVRLSIISRRHNPAGYWTTFVLVFLSLIAFGALALFAGRALL